jgi:hypothetical protein
LTCFAAFFLGCNALITSGGAGGVKISAPASVVDVDFMPISNKVQGFDEQQCVTLTSNVACGGVTLLSGTVVASHFLFFYNEGGSNANPLTYSTTWSFAQNVLCIMREQDGSRIAQTSVLFGNAATQYRTTPQANYGQEPATVGEVASFAGNQVTEAGAISIQVDAIRVITGSNCEPQNSPPVCTGASLVSTQNWPPNHKMAKYFVQGVTDPDGDTVEVTINSVLQDEVAFGPGEPHCPDALISDNTVMLRRERFGNGNGRVYKVTFTAYDVVGASCSGTLNFCVPHDQDQPNSCVDDGAVFDSTICSNDDPVPPDS